MTAPGGRPLAVVKLTDHGIVLRWHFVLLDEAGEPAYTGDDRITKLEAIHDRAALMDQAAAWRRRRDEGYADPDPVLQLMLRAEYDTRDRTRAPGG